MHSSILLVGYVHSWSLLQHWSNPYLWKRIQCRFGLLHPVPTIGSVVEAASVQSEEDAVVRNLPCWYLVSIPRCCI